MKDKILDTIAIIISAFISVMLFDYIFLISGKNITFSTIIIIFILIMVWSIIRVIELIVDNLDL